MQMGSLADIVVRNLWLIHTPKNDYFSYCTSCRFDWCERAKTSVARP